VWCERIRAIPPKTRNADVIFHTIWTDTNSEAASAEGWDIFDVDGRGYFEIQKIDEVELFDSDEAAVNFVRMQAFDSAHTFYHAALAVHDWYASHYTRPTP
jgi:hypothetical protein